MGITLAIIGHTGVVGSSMFQFYRERKNNRVLGYSLDPRPKFSNSTYDQINSIADVIFVCVPTPFRRGLSGHDEGALIDVLSNITSGKIVVVRSTVVPTTTERLQKKFPMLKLLYNPEFLSEKTALSDYAKPDRQIVGTTSESRSEGKKILALLPAAPYVSLTTATEAEMIKYVSTMFAVIKIIFGNEVYDLCQMIGADYEQVVNAFIRSKYLTTTEAASYLRVFDQGYRGYRGSCFPKDIRALLSFAKKNRLSLELLSAAYRMNNRLTR